MLVASPVKAKPAEVSVCFTPGNDCESKIVEVIDAASTQIKVQAYVFTSGPIIHALQRAAGRGVEVLVILDKVNNRRYSAATLLESSGIPVWIDDEPAIAHNKVMVVDRHIVIGGSYNYTKSAKDRNAENVTFIESPAIATEFSENWDARLKVSKPF